MPTRASGRRITPACAGKRLTVSLVVCGGKDHPRVCGEKVQCLDHLAGWAGSPPRVRGKVYDGEPYWEAQFGSPPRVRGKGAFWRFLVPPLGITPACAGKREPSAPVGTAGRDHPRVCGEKKHLLQEKEHRKGSPPRVRGKGSPVRGVQRSAGITPACAGKSTLEKSLGSSIEDHPRVCGEKYPRSLWTLRRRGSPPRVRGKAALKAATYDLPRITPACAGKREGTT